MNNDTCIVGYIYICIYIYIYPYLIMKVISLLLVMFPITIKHYESHVIPSGNLT